MDFGQEEEVPAVPATRNTGFRPATGAPSLLTPGRKLGDYLILEQIGQGGMGQVFRAVHERLGKEVVVKVMTAASMENPTAAERFQREMAILGRLQHPHIVLVHDARLEEGILFLVTELIPGVDLARLARTAGPLPTGDALEVVRQACLALEYVHDRGMVHRDIKPGNIMLTPGGVVKVLDLGLARILDVQSNQFASQEGCLLGTADYMAPEQWENSSRVDIRADLYSLGCTLWHLLAGHAPFDDGRHSSLATKLHGHIHEGVPSIQGPRPDVPLPVVHLLDRLLARDPARRFQTPSEVLAALTPFCTFGGLSGLVQRPAVNHEPPPEAQTSVPPQPTTLPESRPIRSRGPRRFWVIGAGVLAVALGILVWLVLTSRSKDPELTLAYVDTETGIAYPINTDSDPLRRRDRVRVEIRGPGEADRLLLLVLDGEGEALLTSSAELKAGGVQLVRRSPSVTFLALWKPTAWTEQERQKLVADVQWLALNPGLRKGYQFLWDTSRGWRLGAKSGLRDAPEPPTPWPDRLLTLLRSIDGLRFHGRTLVVE